MSGEIRRIFISYSNRDKDIAIIFDKELKKLLVELHPTIKIDTFVKTFIAERDIEGDWHRVLRDQLEESDYLVCIATDRIRESFWVTYEIGAFWLTKKPLYILQLMSSDDNMPSPLTMIQSEKSYQTLITHLFSKLLISKNPSEYKLNIAESAQRFERGIKEKIQAIKAEQVSKFNLSESNLQRAAQWEENNPNGLDYYYVILPEYIPNNSKNIIAAMIKNIDDYGTQYRYLFHQKGEMNIVDLTEMINTLVNSIEDEKLKFKYLNHIEYCMLPSDQLVEHFLYRTQIWYKKTADTDDSACVVMLNEKLQIAAMRFMAPHEIHNLSRIIASNERNWKFENFLEKINNKEVK